MVSVVVSRSCSLGFSPIQGHCVVFLSKTLYAHGVSPYSGAQMGTSEFNPGSSPAMVEHPIQGGVEIPLVTS